MLAALTEAEANSGEQIKKNGPKSVNKLHWMDIFMDRYPAETNEAKRKAFSRQKSGLVNEGFVQVCSNYYTRISK